MHGGAMQIEKALGEDSDGDNAAGQDRPHEQPALLNVINHRGYLLSSFSRTGQAISGQARYEAWTKGEK